VPTKLVVYAGEGHSFRDPKNQLDVMRRSLAWFDKYLGAEE
jgi:dipeptidyl aminopeptidase/acylaminoacyl peptidase